MEKKVARQRDRRVHSGGPETEERPADGESDGIFVKKNKVPVKRSSAWCNIGTKARQDTATRLSPRLTGRWLSDRSDLSPGRCSPVLTTI